ncbi:MAG: N-acetylmuramoyl-L-alanine amidase [Armatimonadetes bacterium]|nr:N-acetylmuramoyl-L-alanine amidase [Armatimonadota bacterium]
MSLRVALVSVLFFLSVPFLGADAPASRYIVFGETVACSSPVILRQGRLYVPLNESCQWLRVEANLQGETVTLRGRGGEARPPVAMSNGTRYVPAGALAEAASADIVWDAAQRTLVISGRLQDVFMEGSVLRLSLASPGKPPRWRIGRLHNPERLFIDLPGLRCVRLGSKEFAGSPVARIRTGQFKPEIARVVIELRQKASARWQPTEDPSLMEFLLEPETGRKRMEKPPRYSTEKPPAASNITKAPPKKSSIPAQVTNIRIESADESKARIWVETSGSARSKPFFLRNPVRLAVDVQNATLGALGSIDVPENPIVKGIRAAQFKTDVARIVLDLSRMVTFSVVSSSNPSGFWMELGMPEGSPGSLPGKTVVVDPGHGGKDTGTRGLSLRLLEKDINLDIALRLESLLRAAGVNVLLTRREDVFISLSDRVAFAEANAADFFISIHCDNSGGSRSVSGTKTYYHGRRPENIPLAQAIQSGLVGSMGTRDQGVRADTTVYGIGFHVIRNTDMPGVLVETAYLSNPDEEALLSDPAVRQKGAEGICNGLKVFVEGYDAEGAGR